MTLAVERPLRAGTAGRGRVGGPGARGRDRGGLLRLLEEILQEAQEHWTLQKPSSPRG